MSFLLHVLLCDEQLESSERTLLTLRKINVNMLVCERLRQRKVVRLRSNLLLLRLRHFTGVFRTYIPNLLLVETSFYEQIILSLQILLIVAYEPCFSDKVTKLTIILLWRLSLLRLIQLMDFILTRDILSESLLLNQCIHDVLYLLHTHIGMVRPICN